jgi:hypothetical protein
MHPAGFCVQNLHFFASLTPIALFDGAGVQTLERKFVKETKTLK